MALLQVGGQGEPMRPTSNWSIDYGDDACTLSRSFGTTGSSFALRREDIAREGAVALLTLPNDGQSRTGSFKGNLVMEGDESLRINAVSRPVSDRDLRVVTVHLDAAGLAKLASTPKFAFPVGRNEQVWLEPGRLDEALAALSKCSDDLVSSLGVPVAELDAVSQPAEPVGTIDLSPRRYPSELKGRYWEARSKALFEIDAQGGVTGCRMVAYTGPEALRGSACEQPFQMRFKPARSEEGVPVRSWVVLSVTSKPCVGRPTRNGEMTC